MIVLDASAAADLLLPRGPQGTWVEERIRERSETLHAPHLIDLEVASAARRWVARRDISPRRGRLVLENLANLGIVRYPHSPLLERIWQLRPTLSAYDAAYVALAEALGAMLLTTDRALARSHGHGARIAAFPG